MPTTTLRPTKTPTSKSPTMCKTLPWTPQRLLCLIGATEEEEAEVEGVHQNQISNQISTNLLRKESFLFPTSKGAGEINLTTRRRRTSNSLKTHLCRMQGRLATEGAGDEEVMAEDEEEVSRLLSHHFKTQE